MDKNIKWGLIGLGVGIAAGAAAGMLLAPKSGKETREQLVKEANKAKAGAGKQLSAAKDQITRKTKKSSK